MQISCPWNILSQLWSPEAAHGYRGRDSERGMGEKQSRKEGVHSERGCIGCLNSSKSWGSAVCVCVYGAMSWGRCQWGWKGRGQQMRGLKCTS